MFCRACVPFLPGTLPFELLDGNNQDLNLLVAHKISVLQLKRASSDDMLTKPGVAAASGVSRLKKTITTGAISELAESRLKPSTGR